VEAEEVVDDVNECVTTQKTVNGVTTTTQSAGCLIENGVDSIF